MQGSVRECEGARGAQGSAGPRADWVLLDRLVFTLLLHTRIKC